MQRRHHYGAVLRVLAFAVLAAGSIVFATDLYRIFKEPYSNEFIMTVPPLRASVSDYIICLGFTGILWGIGIGLDRQPQSNNRIIDATEHSAHLLEEIRAAVNGLARAAAAQPRIAARTPTAPPPSSQPPPPSSPPPEFARPPAAELATTLERVASSLEEIREVSLLNEEQRKARLKSQAEKRRATDLAAAASHVRLRQWAKAEKLIEAMEAAHPGDAEVARLRKDLLAGRAAAETEGFARARARADDLMAISSWDQARQVAADFCENFPTNKEGAALLARVQRERGLFMESTVHRLYEEIKAASDRRQWRKAYSSAQRLMQKFPNHRKTEKIRAQIHTIQDNAELEERQETEKRIHELVHAKRFPEAIELAEYLLDRYPNSAAAASLEELLPKMRQLAIEADLSQEAAAASSDFIDMERPEHVADHTVHIEDDSEEDNAPDHVEHVVEEHPPGEIVDRLNDHI